MRLLPVFFLLLSQFGFAQLRQATVSGKVVDENENLLSGASVSILGKRSGVVTSDSGTFIIQVVAGKAVALIFSYTGLKDEQRNFFLSPGESETITVRMLPAGKDLSAVIIADERERKENSLVRINPKHAIVMPGPSGGVEALIKTFVGTNNELTSQYNVRGGNFDENLVYINDFEIYRPYLVSSGQQEGLSFINPELARNVNFYSGGFQAKYGDKMSSVLDIQYKRPAAFGGSAYVSFLEQGFHVEGASKNKSFTYLAGVRNKNNRNVLSNQPTQGAYIPSSSDFQGFATYKISSKVQVEMLGIISLSRFTFYPESVRKTSSVFSPFYSANLGLDIYFEGQERDRYRTSLVGATFAYNPFSALRLKWMFSHFLDKEEENFDIGGAYLFGDRDFDDNSSTFGQIINPLGAGYYQDYGRNSLDISSLNFGHKGSLQKRKHFFQWGYNIDLTSIHDKLKQWQYQDSAGYSIPLNPTRLELKSSVNSTADLDVWKISGYIQDNLHFFNAGSDITVQGGLRYHYNDLNKEFLLSPRVQASIKPFTKKDFVIKVAAGLYHQPPFYRELRDFNGNLNKDIKAQKSAQFVAGMDYNFKGAGGRPMRFTAEAYYKNMWDVVTYDIDNVKIRYSGSNNAKAYATGLELRLFGELLKDAESWVSVGFMRTREDLENDHYFNYYNASGELITSNTQDRVVADSSRQDVGYVRRPSDRLITAGLFLQDYLSTNKNFKVHLNLIYGSNMSYNIPQSVRYRNGLIIEPYIRADLGFSVLLLGEQSRRRSHDPFRGLKSAWLSLEVFNLIDRANTISYQLIKDFSNTTFAIPNRLTPRLLNMKLLVRF